MSDAEQLAMVIVGAVGLVLFAAGAMAAALPRPDAPDVELIGALQRGRSRIIAGSVCSVAGCALLLWPLAAVGISGEPVGEPVWTSLRLAALATWVLGFSMLALSAAVVVAAVWREPAEVPTPTLRLARDGAHLATWSVSAPLGAVSVVATTVVAVQAGTCNAVVIVLAAAKVATVLLELAGTGRRAGWNVGGWAAGSSGYVTVAWFAALLVALA